MPVDWKLANVIPFKKRGWKEDSGNFSFTDLIFYDIVTHLDVVFPEFSKAFDLISQSILLENLAAHGLDRDTVFLGEKLIGWLGLENGGEWCYIELVAGH